MPWSITIMVVLIVLITTIGRVAKERHRARHVEDKALPADTIAARDEVRQLKERVAVLERVITDNHGSLDLDRQIEQLRDR